MFQAIIKNSLWQWAGKFVGLIFGFLATILLIRYLGDRQYGYYTTVMAYLHFAVVLIDLGLYFILVKQLSSGDHHKTADNIFTLRLVSGLAAILIFGGLAWLIPGYNLTVKIGIFICSLNFLLILLTQVVTAIFQQAQKTVWVALAEASAKIFLLISVLGVIHLWSSGIYSVFIVTTLTTVLNFIILFLAVRPYHRFKLAFDFACWKKYLSASWPMGLSIALSLVYFKGDSLILSLFRPAEEVGIYGAVYKILEVLVTLPVIFSGLVLPLFSAAYLRQQSVKIKSIIQKSFDLISLLALPMVGGIVIIAPQLMSLVAGSRFTSDLNILGQLLRVLIFAAGLIFFNTFFTYLIVTVNRQKSMLKGYFFTALTSLILYLIFIPRYSYFGAAGVTVYSEFFILIFSLYLVLKTVPIKLKLNLFFKALIGSVLMSLILAWVNFLPLAALILLGIIIYILWLYLTGINWRDYVQEIN